MDLHDELPTFDYAGTIDSIMTNNQDHFLRRNGYYEIALKILANFKECPVVTMDIEGNIQYSIAHDTAFCSTNPQETYMRLLVKPETPADSRKLMIACQGDVITSFPYKNAIKVSLPSMEDIAKATDKEALALLFDNIDSTTPKQLVYSAVVLPTELMMTILENKTKTPFATLALIWDYFIQEGILRGPKGGKRTIPDQVTRIINFFGMHHIYHATLEQEESDTAKKYRHLMKQFGVTSMTEKEMDEKTNESLKRFTHQSMIKLKIIHHSTPMKQNGGGTPTTKEERKTSTGDANGTPSKGSPSIPKKTKASPTQSSLIAAMVPPPSTPPSKKSSPSPSRSSNGGQQPTPPSNNNLHSGNIGGTPTIQQNTPTSPHTPSNMSQVAIDALIALKSTIQSVNVNMGAINDSISANTQASGSSHKGVDGWGDIEIAGVKVLSSPDPSNPIDSIRPRTKLLCGMKPTDTIRKIKRDNRNCDWAWNIAMISANEADEDEPPELPIPTKSKSEHDSSEGESTTAMESGFIQQLRRLATKVYPPNNKPKFIFENTKEAANANSKIIGEHDNDLQKAIDAIENTILHPGTEYRPISDLEEIFNCHVDWEKFKQIATEGVKYHIDEKIEYTEETRRKDLQGAIAKGNNKSALAPEMQEIIKQNYDKEVNKGWMIPINIETLEFLENAGVIPIGISKQWTTNAQGERVRKNRTAHDCSRPMQSGLSINLRIDRDLLYPCLFAGMLIRYLHQLHDMRIRHSRRPILQGKTDLDAAFRRVHVWLKHAIMACTIIIGMAYILLRIPFGVSEGPGQHDVPSNMVVDLAQRILDDDTWDPSTLHSPHAHAIPQPEELPADVEYGEAFPLAVELDKVRDAYIDGYVDDLCALVVKIRNIPERGRQAVALAIHAFFRPTNADDPIPRDDVLSLRKLLGEGKLEEVKVILGWIIDTRRFLIKLTQDKADAWHNDIENMIKKIQAREHITLEEIQAVHGRLNTAAHIHSDMRYFNTCLTWCMTKAGKSGGKIIPPLKLIKDLRLWQVSLARLANEGRSINHITFTLPHLFTKQDASNACIGGFNCTGLAWRWIIPEILRGKIHINILEFMAVVVSTWMTVISLDMKNGRGMKILGQTDNTSALGWLKSASKFNKNKKLNSMMREEIGRKLTEILMEADMSNYSQHVAGEENDVADCITRSNHLTNEQLIHYIQQEYGDRIPENLRFVELPEVVSSWIVSTMESAIQGMGLPKGHKKELLTALQNGKNSQPRATLTSSSETAHASKELKSLVVSRTASDIISVAKKLRMNLEDEQFKPKSTVFQRPSGRWVTQTP